MRTGAESLLQLETRLSLSRQEVIPAPPLETDTNYRTMSSGGRTTTTGGRTTTTGGAGATITAGRTMTAGSLR